MISYEKGKGKGPSMSDTTKEDHHTGLYVNLTLYTIQSIQPVAISLTIGASVQGYGEQCSEDLIYSTLTPLLIQVAVIVITQPNT